MPVLRNAWRGIGVALAALACVATAYAQDPGASVVQNAAREWLAAADTLDGGKTWRAAGEKFRQAITVEKWTDALEQVRKPLGDVGQRTAAATNFSKSLPGVPDGEYATLEFHTVFAKKERSSETVRLEHEHDGAWRVIGYFIR